MTLKIFLVLTSLLFIVDGQLECSNRGAETFTIDSKKTDVYEYVLCEFEALPGQIQNEYRMKGFLKWLESENLTSRKVTWRLLALADFVNKLRNLSELIRTGDFGMQDYLNLELERREKLFKYN